VALRGVSASGEGAVMERLALFQALCRIANCLEALAGTPECCGVRTALLRVLKALDRVIDALVTGAKEEECD
jgi:hypothetical protein